MQILLQLGANQTAIIQFFIFAISIAFLTTFVFKPFFKAYDQRLLKTKGAENVAKESIEEAKNLGLIFQSKARESNEKIKSIYNDEKKIAQESTDQLLKSAKKESEIITKQSRDELSRQIAEAKSQVNSLSKDIAKELTQKFSGGL